MTVGKAEASTVGIFLLAVVVALPLSSCGSDEVNPTGPSTGSLQILLTLTGEDRDPDGFSVSVDGDPPLHFSEANPLLITGLVTGEHDVRLEGLSSNCVIDGPNPRVVRVLPNTVATTVFTIGCVVDEGSIEIVSRTDGPHWDLDGYILELDGNAERIIAANDSTTFAAVPSGQHLLTIEEIARNCSLLIDQPISVSVKAGDVTRVELPVQCEAVQQIAISTGKSFGLFDLRDGFLFYFPTPYDSGPEFATGLSWSRDGMRVAISSQEGYCVYDANGAEVLCERTLPLQYPRLAGWSPDGTRLALHFGQTLAIRALGDEGLRTIAVIGPNASIRWANWSPDGSRIGLVIDDATAEQFVLSTIRSDGTGYRVLDTGTTWTDASWSPNGSWLSFSTDESLHFLSVDGAIRLVQEVQAWHVTWSPEGDKIAFAHPVLQSDPHDYDNTEVVVARTDWSEQSVVAERGKCPDWSPDGTEIALWLVNEGLALVHPDGSGFELVYMSDSPCPQWRPY